MKLEALIVTLSLCQGCIAVGALSGAMIGTVAPVLIAADQDKEPVPSTVVLSTLVCAGIGTLLGILSVEDRKNVKAPPDDEDEDDEPDRGDDDS
jgi:hypothetical protein